MRFSRNIPMAPRRAFTLIEVMIVIVIIGLMAGIVTYATSNYLDRAKRQRVKADIAVYSGAVDAFIWIKAAIRTIARD